MRDLVQHEMKAVAGGFFIAYQPSTSPTTSEGSSGWKCFKQGAAVAYKNVKSPSAETAVVAGLVGVAVGTLATPPVGLAAAAVVIVSSAGIDGSAAIEACLAPKGDN